MHRVSLCIEMKIISKKISQSTKNTKKDNILLNYRDISRLSSNRSYEDEVAEEKNKYKLKAKKISTLKHKDRSK